MKFNYFKFKVELGIKQRVGNCKESGYKTLIMVRHKTGGW